MARKNPTGCALWKDPKRVVAERLDSRFELLETLVDDSHWWRYLLKCRECGQLYCYEFYEEVDWVDGEDPQFVYWVPIETAEDMASLKAAPPVAWPPLPRAFARTGPRAPGKRRSIG